MKYPIAVNTFTDKELQAATDVIKSGNVTMGKLTEAFEFEFADYVAAKYAVMVNSGSSANYLASKVIFNGIDEVTAPYLTFGTTLFPLMELNKTLYLADVNTTFHLDLSRIPIPAASIVVHFMGREAEIPFDGITLEDSCEYLVKGTGVKDIKTYSFYFSHTISTIEGGMIVTDDQEIANECRSLRRYGWSNNKHNYIRSGFNMKPTEIQAAIGLVQLKKADSINEKKAFNSKYLTEHIQLPVTLPTSDNPTLFYYPIVTKQSHKLRQHLEQHSIETRPLSGNYLHLLEYRKLNDPIVARQLFDNAFCIGNNITYTEADLKFIVGVINEFRMVE